MCGETDNADRTPLNNLLNVIDVKHNRLIRLLPALATVAIALAISGCNSKSDTPEAESIVETSTAIKNFHLASDSKVMSDLDDVFFSIDLENAVVFNADSLPKGTDATKLVPVITFPSEMSEVTIQISGATSHNDTIFNYKSHPGDSIDFTGRTVLNVTAPDGVTRRSYIIKVNVHTTDPDSLIWDRMASSALPSRKPSPVDQKTVKHGNEIVSLIEESDASYTIAKTSDIFAGEWVKTEIDFPFPPSTRSFTATDDSFYILDESGNLYESADAIQWNSTGIVWTSITGAYGSHVLGMRADADGLTHTSYPADAALPETPVAADFPVSGTSDFATFTTKWSEYPVGMLTGGRTADGTLSDATWGYDGNIWAKLSAHPLPALEGATLVPYYIYRRIPDTQIYNEYPAWLVIGGRLADGSFNRTVYISYDNGVNWSAGSSLMQTPSFVPDMTFCDMAVVTAPLDANLSDAWTTRANPSRLPAMRLAYETDGYEIKWNCPYIYLFGGRLGDGTLNNVIWRGVLARLTFAPII